MAIGLGATTDQAAITPLLDDGDVPEFPEYDVIDSADLDEIIAETIDTGARVGGTPIRSIAARTEAQLELLTQPSHPIDVSDFGTPELLGLGARLHQLVQMEHAYGLSAVQIGIPARAFVLGLNAGNAGFYVNPEIASHGRDVEHAVEGCLSFPDYARSIGRWRVITARWSDAHGGRHEARLSGIAARVFQHELDHLNGITIRDDNAGAPTGDA